MSSRAFSAGWRRRHDGALQFCARRLRGILSADNDPGSGVWRVDPNGGFGKVLGLVLSLILLQVISTGFNLLGFSPHLTQAIWGATMILAIGISLVRDKWIARLWLKST